jgi:hypothetical protein
MTNPLMDGAENVPQQESAESLPDHAGFDTMGIGDNYQATDHPTVDRHII